jgi:CelD/BcsL family acetyltransferase involved in cellulose biosynthesis
MTPSLDDASITVTELRGEEAFFGFAEGWRALFIATPDPTPFQSFEWLAAWRRRRGRGEPILLIANEGAIPIAAMALTQTRYRGAPLRFLRWMGAPDADYHDFVGGRRRDDCAAAFVGHLRQMPGWHVCELGELRPQTLASLASPLSGATQDSAPCAALRLPASRDEFERQAGRKLRSSIRRRAGMLSEAHPDHHFMTVSRVDELPQAMEDLFRLHTARLNKKGYGGAFATESARAFHRDVAEAFFEKDMLRMHRLMVGDRCIAVIYCFNLRGVTCYYLGGFDPAFSRFSPGVLIIHHAIMAAIEEGGSWFDFMRGGEEYKSRWKAEPRVNGRLLFGRPGLASRAAVAARRFERALWTLWQSRQGGDAESAAAPETQSSNTPSSA